MRFSKIWRSFLFNTENVACCLFALRYYSMHTCRRPTKRSAHKRKSWPKMSTNLEEALDAAHLFDHVGKLFVLREQIFDFLRRRAAAERNSPCPGRLFCEQIVCFRMVELCKSDAFWRRTASAAGRKPLSHMLSIIVIMRFRRFTDSCSLPLLIKSAPKPGIIS